MPKTDLADTGGWIPVIESLCDRLGHEAAMVFGSVWRHCSMRRGICDASIETIAKKAHVSRSTAKRKLKQLCDEGYIVDMTASERHRPHYYQDTGKAGLHMMAYDQGAEFANYIADLEQPMEPIEVVHGEPAVVLGEPAYAAGSGSRRTTKKKEERKEENMTPRTAEEYRAEVLKSMVRGSQNTEDIRATVESRFHIYPNWRAKNWAELLLFIKERKVGETLDAFADWWFENDWRGKQGFPPTCGQIRELWPQAFKGEVQHGVIQNPDGSFN